MNDNNGYHRGVCGEWSGVDLLLLERPDHGPLKVALIAAILLHLLLFWWNIWPQSKERLIPTVKEPSFIVHPYKFKERTLEKKPLQTEKVKKIPIPDRTPHEIEPLFEFVADPEPPALDDAGPVLIADIDPPLQAPPESRMPIRDYEATSRPVVLEKISPDYPRLAEIAGVEGLVILEAVIRKDGTVGQVTVRKAPPGKLGFDRAAVAALRQWIFRPGEMNGRPVDVIMTLTVKFRLSRGAR